MLALYELCNLILWQILQSFTAVLKLNGIKVQVFFGKNIEKNTCTVIIRIIITFGNQIFL